MVPYTVASAPLPLPLSIFSVQASAHFCSDTVLHWVIWLKSRNLYNIILYVFLSCVYLVLHVLSYIYVCVCVCVCVSDLNRCVFLVLQMMNGGFPNPKRRGWYRCVGTVSQVPLGDCTNERVHHHHLHHHTQKCMCAHLCYYQAPSITLLQNEKNKRFSLNETGRQAVADKPNARPQMFFIDRDQTSS